MKSYLSTIALISVLSLGAGIHNLQAQESPTTLPIGPDSSRTTQESQNAGKFQRNLRISPAQLSDLKLRPIGGNGQAVAPQPSLHLGQPSQISQLSLQVAQALVTAGIIKVSPAPSSENDTEITDAVTDHVWFVLHHTEKLPDLDKVMRIIHEMQKACEENHLHLTGQFIRAAFEIFRASGHGVHDTLTPQELKNTLNKMATAEKHFSQNNPPKIAEFKTLLFFSTLSESAQKGVPLKDSIRLVDEQFTKIEGILQNNHLPPTFFIVSELYRVLEKIKGLPSAHQSTIIEKVTNTIHLYLSYLTKTYGGLEKIPLDSLKRLTILVKEGYPLSSLTSKELNPTEFISLYERANQINSQVGRLLRDKGFVTPLTPDDKQLILAIVAQNSGTQAVEDALEKATKFIAFLRKSKITKDEAVLLIKKISSGEIKIPATGTTDFQGIVADIKIAAAPHKDSRAEPTTENPKKKDKDLKKEHTKKKHKNFGFTQEHKEEEKKK